MRLNKVFFEFSSPYGEKVLEPLFLLGEKNEQQVFVPLRGKVLERIRFSGS